MSDQRNDDQCNAEQCRNDQIENIELDNDRLRSAPPALRHGIYAETLLPGEDVTEFEELRKTLICEFAPEGAFENDIVGTMARLIWRKQNLAAFRGKQPWHACLMSSLALEDRLDGLIDKCLKRLLFVRGVKSVSAASVSGASPRLLAATNAA
jgi:hypothetical protein